MNSLKNLLDISVSMNLIAKDNKNVFVDKEEYFQGVEYASKVFTDAVMKEIKESKRGISNEYI